MSEAITTLWTRAFDAISKGSWRRVGYVILTMGLISIASMTPGVNRLFESAVAMLAPKAAPEAAPAPVAPVVDTALADALKAQFASVSARLASLEKSDAASKAALEKLKDVAQTPPPAPVQTVIVKRVAAPPVAPVVVPVKPKPWRWVWED